MRQLRYCTATTDAIVLDHVGHWVPDADAAATRLRALGFMVTPFSEQQQLNEAGELVPAGAGNYCIMLDHGYLEFLTPLADTPVGRELSAGIQRYTGAHIAAFAVADANTHSARLAAAGFAQNPPVALRRAVESENNSVSEAAFTVARAVPPGFPEGRFQMLSHHTPEVIWQARYMSHPNGVCGLAGIVVQVNDLDEAASRFARWFGCRPVPCVGGVLFELGYGDVILTNHRRAAELVAVDVILDSPAIVASILRAGAPDSLWPDASYRCDIPWYLAGDTLGGAFGVIGQATSLATLLTNVNA